MNADELCGRCSKPHREHQIGYSASRCTFSPTPPADLLPLPDDTEIAMALLATSDGDVSTLDEWLRDCSFDRGDRLNFGIRMARSVRRLVAHALAPVVAENAKLREVLEGAASAIEAGGLHDRMCCDGYECGCRGSTFADLLLHDIRAALATAPKEPT